MDKVLVLALHEPTLRVLLLRRCGGRSSGEWQPVTGHVEPGESLAAAARRELREETGLVARVAALGVQHEFDVSDGEYPGHYVEHAFSASVQDVDVALSGEHDAFEWLVPSAASARLRWAHHRDALAKLTSSTR